MSRPNLVPELCVTDIVKSLSFYCDILKFQIDFERPEQGFATVCYEGSYIMLETETGIRKASDEEFQRGSWRTGDFDYPLGRGINLEMTVSDSSVLYQRLVTAGLDVKVKPYEKWYRVGTSEVGVLQFLVLDPDGYLLRFSQEIGTREARATVA